MSRDDASLRVLVALSALMVMLSFTSVTQAVVIQGVKQIRITDNDGNWFYLEEVNLFNTAGVDVASTTFGNAVKTSGTPNFAPGFGSAAAGAIDGIVGGCCGTGTHSPSISAVPAHNYTINLPYSQDIDAANFPMQIFNRTDGCCPERAENFNIEFLDLAGNPIAINNGSGGSTTSLAINGPASFATHFPLGGGTLAINGLSNQPATQILVGLQNATSQAAQTGFGGLTPDKMIDGSLAAQNGWGNGPPGGSFSSNVAVFETADDITADITKLEFRIDFAAFADHGLGKFRLSLTTDDRSDFADGLFQGGDVTANWIEITPESATAASGAILTIGLDNTIEFTSDPLLFNPTTDSYVIKASTTVRGITGFRLEAIQDPSLPVNGPGLSNSNGNFVVSEFTVLATRITIPEPTSIALLGVAGLALMRRRRLA